MLPLQLLSDSEGCFAGANPTIERYFHDCVYDTRDLIGFYFGLMSISCWVVAQVPQLITNYHRQSAEALSPFFLAQWLLGDTCNLLGALLKGDQPETVILTAQYFICMDVVLLVQYLYYTAVSRRLERTYALAARRHHRYHGHHGHGHHHGHHRHHSNRHQQLGSGSRDGLSNSTSGGVRAAIEDGNIDNEIESSSGITAVSMLQSTGDVEHTGISSERRPKVVAAAAAVVTGVTTIAGSLAIFISFNTSSPSSSFPSITAAFPLIAYTIKEWQQSTGSTLGYISCVLYLASRISQILKNSQRQSAEGLASSMFLCAVAANLFYGTSVLMRSRTKTEIISSFPWVLGSLGTVVLDGIILMQTVLFAKEERKNNAGSTNATSGAGTSAAILSRSDIEQPLLEELGAAQGS